MSDSEITDDETPSWARGLQADDAFTRPGAAAGMGDFGFVRPGGFGRDDDSGMESDSEDDSDDEDEDFGGGRPAAGPIDLILPSGVVGIDMLALARHDEESSSGSDSEDDEEDLESPLWSKVWGKAVMFDEAELPMIDIGAEIREEEPGLWQRRKLIATRHWMRLEQSKRAAEQENLENRRREEREIRKAHAQARYELMRTQKQERRKLIRVARKQLQRRLEEEKSQGGKASATEEQDSEEDDDPFEWEEDESEEENSDDDDEDSDAEEDPQLRDAVAQIDERLQEELQNQELKLAKERDARMAELEAREQEEEAALDREWEERMAKLLKSLGLGEGGGADQVEWDISEDDDESFKENTARSKKSKSQAKSSAGGSQTERARRAKTSSKRSSAVSKRTRVAEMRPALTPEQEAVEKMRKEALKKDRRWLRQGISVELFRPELASTMSPPSKDETDKTASIVVRVLVPGSVFAETSQDTTSDTTITLKVPSGTSAKDFVALVAKKISQKGLADQNPESELQILHPQAHHPDWVVPGEVTLQQLFSGGQSTQTDLRSVVNLQLLHRAHGASTHPKESSVSLKVSSLREGSMHKTGGFRKGIKRRWFVLLPDCLQYYRNPADPNSLAGTVFFTPESKVGLPTSGAGKEDPTAFTLTPYPGGREYLFTAQSRVDRIHWVWSLESAIANCKARQASRDTAADGKQTYTSAKQTRLTWEKSKSDPQGVFRWEGKGVQGSLVVQDVSDVILSDVLNSFDPKIAGVDPARLVTILGHTEGRGVQLNLACQSSQEATRLFRALRRLLSLRSDPLLANEAMTRLTVLSNTSIVREALRKAARTGEKLMGGLLFKQGGRWKSWKPRYFLTQPQGDSVCYYELLESQESVLKKRGTIPLFGAHIEALPDDEIADRPHCFVIKPTGTRRTFVMQAASALDRAGWIHFLHSLQEASGMEASDITGSSEPITELLSDAQLSFARPASPSQSASGSSPHSIAVKTESLLPPTNPASPTEITAASQQVIMQGELDKLAGKGGIWRARFFQLQAVEPSHLYYFQVKRAVGEGADGLVYHRTGSVPLRGAAVERIEGRGRDRLFTITPYGSRRPYMLRAPSTAMRDRWISTISRHVKGLSAESPDECPIAGSLEPDEHGNLMTGFLVKRGKRNSAFRERWFALTRDTLMYYKKINSPKPAGAILLGGAKVESLDADPKYRYKFAFSVTPAMGKRSYILAATDQAGKQAWIDLIQKVIEKS